MLGTDISAGDGQRLWRAQEHMLGVVHRRAICEYLWIVTSMIPSMIKRVSIYLFEVLKSFNNGAQSSHELSGDPNNMLQWMTRVSGGFCLCTGVLGCYPSAGGCIPWSRIV